MKIKVCGMRDPQNIRAVEELGIDFMGLIFFPPSPRNVESVPSYLPQHVHRVGVFVNEPAAFICQRVKEYGLNAIQLHGTENAAYISELRQLCPGLTFIKALNIASDLDLDQVEQYVGLVDYMLFDTKSKLVGGNGEQFDWSVLQGYDGPIPFFLSGGIGPTDSERIRSFSHPYLAGIDLNSRFEAAPALKDVEALRSFIQKLKN